MKRAARRHLFVALACVLCALALGGCAQLGSRDAIEDLSQFRPLPESDQVRYAPGGERFAREVAVLLPQAVAQIEAMQYRPFREPPVVYVCGDDACFDRFVDPRWNFAAAVVYDNRLLLGGRLFEQKPHRVAAILQHELSHLHLGQRLGHYSMRIPVWFHEGLAAFAAHGGGADLVSNHQAWAAAAAHHHFLPEEEHLPWRRRMAVSWKLPPAIFYRQAMLFVESLHRRDPAAFRRLLTALQDGADFDAAFAQTYHPNPAGPGAAFFAHAPAEAAAAAAPCAIAAACTGRGRSVHAKR
jgi:hypothetical protein